MKYYLHDSNSFSDEKITELYITFGYEGLGLFYTLLEKLAQQEKPIKTSVLKAQLKVGKKLDKIWKFMEEIGLIYSNNGDTFNEQLLKFSEKYTIKKEKNAKRISEWRKNQDVTKNVTCNESVRNTSKDNISKDNISKQNNNNLDIDKIYNLYPAKCPFRNVSTGKTKKNKDKIKTLLNDYSVDELETTIKTYVSECIQSKTYLKNFSTFLNNLPDYSQSEQELKTIPYIPNTMDLDWRQQNIINKKR